jgi:hypothetical protein
VFAYELLKFQGDWMPGKVVRAHITQKLQFNRFSSSAPLTPDVTYNDRLHTQVIKLTTIAPGTYSAISHSVSAEFVPVGVAESAYRSAAAQQWAGKIVFTKAQLRSDIPLGVRLKLVGPTTTFTNVLVQQIDERPVFGETAVTYGPCAPIDIDMWIEMARATRTRTTYDMPSGRGDGGTGLAAGDLDSGGHAPVENTAHGVGSLNLHSVIYQQS